MKKALMILVPAIIFLACIWGYINNQSSYVTTVIINRGHVSSDKISAEITNVNYDEGWLTGTINIYDESILAYYNAKTDPNSDFVSFLESMYDLTIEIDEAEEALTGDSGGYKVIDSGYSSYTKSFTRYLKDPDNGETIRIHIQGIDEPLEISLKTSHSMNKSN